MADDNFTTNQKMLGNCVRRIEIILLAIIRRMAIIIDDRNDKTFSPLGRARDLGSFYLLTSLIPIRLKLRQYNILIIGQPKSSILTVRAYAYMLIEVSYIFVKLTNNIYVSLKCSIIRPSVKGMWTTCQKKRGWIAQRRLLNWWFSWWLRTP